MADVLLANGADVNAKDKGAGRTPLHYAAEQNHREMVELLLARGADVNARDHLAHTAQYWATILYHRKEVSLDIVELLREHSNP